MTVNLRVKRDGFIDVPRGGVVMVSPRTGLWVGVVQPRACAECLDYLTSALHRDVDGFLVVGEQSLYRRIL